MFIEWLLTLCATTVVTNVLCFLVMAVGCAVIACYCKKKDSERNADDDDLYDDDNDDDGDFSPPSPIPVAGLA